MSFRNLRFRDLQFVIAIAECGSFSRAAEACAITQSALSERIKRIELDLGVELFERNKRSLNVTPDGERLGLKALDLLDDPADIDAIVSSSREPFCGPLRVGVIATLGPCLMPLVLPRIRKEHPKLELVIHEGLTDSLVEFLQAGCLDIVIAAAPIHLSGIDKLHLFDEPFVLGFWLGTKEFTLKTSAAMTWCFRKTDIVCPDRHLMYARQSDETIEADCMR